MGVVGRGILLAPLRTASLGLNFRTYFVLPLAAGLGICFEMTTRPHYLPNIPLALRMCTIPAGRSLTARCRGRVKSFISRVLTSLSPNFSPLCLSTTAIY